MGASFGREKAPGHVTLCDEERHLHTMIIITAAIQLYNLHLSITIQEINSLAHFFLIINVYH
jgi:hypothetical protein